MLSTRTARNKIAIIQAERVIKQQSTANQMDGRAINATEQAVLHGYGYPLPLGWRLSPITRLLILGQNGDSNRCNSDDDNSDCLVAKIYNQLNR
jgi:hypothetical protein